MAAIRPEGLSPCFESILSPYIPSSYFFEWDYRKETSSDKQTKADIRWYDMESDTPILLKTKTITGTAKSVSYLDSGLSLESGSSYAWQVRTYNSKNEVSQWSELASFLFDDVILKMPIFWEMEAKMGERVENNEVFQEIKTHLTDIISDYVGQGVEDEQKYMDLVEELFTGRVVPSRKDFTTLRDAINFVAVKKEIMSPFDVIGPIKNGLGASDMKLIHGFLLAMASNPPQAPRGVSITAKIPTIQDVASISGSTKGTGDTTVEVEWDVEEYDETTGKVNFTKLSTSEDISYYEVIFQYGVDGNMIEHVIYYRPEDLVSLGNGFEFSTNWNRIFTTSNIANAKHAVYVRAIDLRGNQSTYYNTSKSYGGTTKIPLGVRAYNMQYQKDTDAATKWYSVAGIKEFTKTAYSHNLGQNKFKVRYRIQTIDKTGMLGSWVTSSWIDFRGLVPPGPPKNLKYTSTYKDFTVTWQAGTYATSYELKVDDSGVKPASQLKYTSVDKKANTYYTFYVRSVNAVGKSAYVSIKVKTKLPPTATKTYGVTASGRSWRTNYKSYRGIVAGSSGWRMETTDVIQGRWEYLENTYDDWDMDGRKDDYVYKGMHNGNHKGLWFPDYVKIRSDLKGKKIKTVQVYVSRESSQHGYPKDATPIYLWLHNYASKPSGEPTLFNEFKFPKYLDRGQSAWVTIPTSMFQKIIDGQARGFAVHKKNIGGAYDVSYQRFDSKIQIKVTYYNY